MGRISIGGVIYLVIGVFVAANAGYTASLVTIAQILSLLVAILLWPLVLLGANLHLVF
jgi:ABC-type anion transport system duplicated permease subunit